MDLQIVRKGSTQNDSLKTDFLLNFFLKNQNNKTKLFLEVFWEKYKDLKPVETQTLLRRNHLLKVEFYHQ